MRIHMAARTALFGKVILPCARHGGIRIGQRLMAFRTSQGQMSIYQGKFGPIMPGQVERGRLENILRVALFAMVRVRLAAEFAGMHIRVAVETNQLIQFVNGLFAGRRLTVRGVAFLAFQLEMLRFQLEPARLMHFARVKSRFPLRVVVAGRAIRSRPARRILARGKLSAVDVSMAILALFMFNGFGKTVVFVALPAA